MDTYRQELPHTIVLHTRTCRSGTYPPDTDTQLHAPVHSHPTRTTAIYHYDGQDNKFSLPLTVGSKVVIEQEILGWYRGMPVSHRCHMWMHMCSCVCGVSACLVLLYISRFVWCSFLRWRVLGTLVTLGPVSETAEGMRHAIPLDIPHSYSPHTSICILYIYIQTSTHSVTLVTPVILLIDVSCDNFRTHQTQKLGGNFPSKLRTSC